ncbi:peptide chain release factor 2 [Geomonas sp. Red69]|uniref:Peptide chain release factor 2 n=1 Tax=Geomonas diazotrophica TaxID=2843197 RepID=A0ABX8JDV6_9BACT|nr:MULTISPECIES: peptide chain release factor 2 [Geomonas]MBU5638793.1 peptide chain release factor 2 [Geomonas diazotrophica]QWV96590.1 peptide chain release factor 2 [Geomonas nitrogeniifigens]QXE85692.1 peptide chain release factor 2 [Geomonas nitrogeniifigens]
MFREEIAKIEDLAERIHKLRGSLDVDDKRERMHELEELTSRADFWNDAEKAQKVLKDRMAMEKDVTTWETLERQARDIQELIELGNEEQDEATLAEVHGMNEQLEIGVSQAEFRRMLSGPHDASGAFVSINSGAGGTESQDWAEMLLRMYLRYCEKKGWKTEITDYQEGDGAGIKGVTFAATGEFAYGYLKAEAGIHRLVRISPFDSSARRHTSFASVFVFPVIEEDDIEIKIPESDLRIDTYRSSGAGGQHVNTTDSAIRITHLPTGTVVACQSERSQHMNKATAMKVLRSKLYEMELREREAKAADIAGEKKEIGWGSQIRSYVLHPYKMVKDLRTGVESGNPDNVLDGALDDFVVPYLMGVRRETKDI